MYTTIKIQLDIEPRIDPDNEIPLSIIPGIISIKQSLYFLLKNLSPKEFEINAVEIID